MATVVPSGHYSANREEPIFFYRGRCSNFDTDHPLFLVPPIPSLHVAFRETPLRYRSGEHWLHCGKARDWNEHEKIRRARTPFEAKEFGSARCLPLDVDEVREWNARRYDHMVVGLRAKTIQHSDVLSWLMRTGDRLIAEDSPVDFIWGIRDARGGLGGLNLLGKAWMQVREELRSA